MRHKAVAHVDASLDVLLQAHAKRYEPNWGTDLGFTCQFIELLGLVVERGSYNVEAIQDRPKPARNGRREGEWNDAQPRIQTVKPIWFAGALGLIATTERRAHRLGTLSTQYSTNGRSRTGTLG
jgi:hypothetical protein